MDMNDLRKAFTEAAPGTYRWYAGVYCEYLDNYVTHVARSEKPLIFSIFRKLRDEHTINWSRNYLYEFDAARVPEVRTLLLRTIRRTDRFNVLKGALYLLRNLRRNCVLDDYLLRLIPDLKRFLEDYKEPEVTPLRKKVMGMSRSEHSLRDLESLFIANRGFDNVMSLRESQTRESRYHNTAINSVEMILTEECNLKCFNCDKMCGKAESFGRMTVDQVKKFIEESKECGKQWGRIGISGGEATLHPDIMEIVGLVLEYRNTCLLKSSFVQIVSSGYGGANKVLQEIVATYTQDVMPSTPSNTFIRNNAKRNKVVLHSPVNEAPIDKDDFRDSEFRNGCWVPETCGVGLSRHGYYCCGTASAIDRVFGYDMGIKSLKDVNMRRIVEQRAVMCRLCGRYNDLSIDPEHYGPTWVVEEKVSHTWERAFQAYRENGGPVLTLY